MRKWQFLRVVLHSSVAENFTFLELNPCVHIKSVGFEYSITNIVPHMQQTQQYNPMLPASFTFINCKTDNKQTNKDTCDKLWLIIYHANQSVYKNNCYNYWMHFRFDSKPYTTISSLAYVRSSIHIQFLLLSSSFPSTYSLLPPILSLSHFLLFVCKMKSATALSQRYTSHVYFVRSLDSPAKLLT